MSKDKCTCGCNFPVLEKIEGRSDDVIITPDGKKIGRLSPVLKGFPVKEAQYIQDEIESIRVIIVKAEGFKQKDESEIKRELAKRVGTKIKINVEYTEKIERGPGGKYKNVISRINKKNNVYAKRIKNDD